VEIARVLAVVQQVSGSTPVVLDIAATERV
jgi:hypothetical protein